MIRRSSMPQQISKAGKKALKNHSKHHTKKHMASMKKAMKKGKTFTQAHKKAMRKLGK